MSFINVYDEIIGKFCANLKPKETFKSYNSTCISLTLCQKITLFKMSL